MVDPKELRARVDQLFHHFERGEWEEAKSLFTPHARLSQKFGGGGGRSHSYEEFAANAKKGALAQLGLPSYSNRRVSITEGGRGFLEEHLTTLTVGGKSVALEVCLVGTFAKDTALIHTLDEYLDPSPLAKAFAATTSAPVKDTIRPAPSLPPDTCVVITGASSGIGEEVAYLYAAQGCKVCLAGRREAELRRVAGECMRRNPNCETLVCGTDVAVKEQCQRLVTAVVARFGRIDRLYLNAGVSQACTLEESSEDLVEDLMKVNFFGAAWTAKAALPHLKKAQGSKVAVVSSALGKLVAPTQAVYCASKWALHGFFGSLRCELEPHGISVTIICPGPVRTPIQQNLYGPGNTKVAFQVDEQAAESMMSAATAAELCYEACETDAREVVFGKELKRLVAMRPKAPEQVDQILSGLYNSLAENSTPAQPTSKL